MSCHTKEQLENMLEDVVNELNLSDSMIEKHGPLGTPPAELVRIVLQQKDMVIEALRRGFAVIEVVSPKQNILDKQDEGKVDMTIIEGADFKVFWECSGCKTEHNATKKFEQSKSCPNCGKLIEKWIGADDE